MTWLTNTYQKIKRWWKQVLIGTGIVGIAMAASMGAPTDVTTDLAEIEQAQDAYFQEHGKYYQVIDGDKKPTDYERTPSEVLGFNLPTNHDINVYETPDGEWGYQVASTTDTHRGAKGYGKQARERTYYNEIKTTASTTSLWLPDFSGVAKWLEPTLAYAASTQSADLEQDNTESFSINDADQTGLAFTSDFTVEGWINIEAATGEELVFGKSSAAGDQRGYQMYVSTGNDQIKFAISSDGSSETEKILAVTFNTNTWYHVAYAYDASAGEMEFFLDGTSQGTTTGLPTSIFDNSAAAGVGFINGSGGLYDGHIFDLRAWDDVRTSTEINDNTDCHIDSTSTNLQANWFFDGDAIDETTNNNDLTNNNTVQFVADIPSSHSGEVCGAAEEEAPGGKFNRFE